MSTATLNECRLIGNVGADPEVRSTSTGKRLASISLATTMFFGDRVVTEWHRVVFWGALAERVAQHVRKGSSIFVGGRLQGSSWVDKEGVQRHGVDVVADQMQLLGGKRPGHDPSGEPSEGVTEASEGSSRPSANGAPEQEGAAPF